MLDTIVEIIFGCCAVGAAVAILMGIGPGTREEKAVSDIEKALEKAENGGDELKTENLMDCASAEAPGQYLLVIAVLLLFVAPSFLTQIIFRVLGL